MTSDETGLPPRYEIRTLVGPEHAKWACALVTHCSIFASPVFSKVHTTTSTQSRTQLCYAMFRTALYQMSHQVDSGLSLGIFDTEYQFKRHVSAETGGKLYWDLENDASTSTRSEQFEDQLLLEQMDFPLVSVALAYDSFCPLDPTKLQPLYDLFPLIPLRNKATDKRDHRNPAEWQATGPGEVLFRGGTATKAGEEGKGFMKKLSWYMMRKAAADWRFRGIQIGTVHDAVSSVWSRPPAPFTAEVVVRFKCKDDDDDEELRKCFEGSDQEVTMIYVTLKAPN
ncbi:hypothetical protein B0H66DRAFT_546417 [Apodospora peruviana]|uniref:Uncharacterized protein n=1 Tax=Apodospora peruviana TaxID=516989 RepID=A0AAE0IU82_9PEZI|nr:hypothetical protein B0H66DRAFT_546417 [Apodospora peruviana]